MYRGDGKFQGFGVQSRVALDIRQLLLKNLKEQKRNTRFTLQDIPVERKLRNAVP